jgi:hypothetical protein
VEAVVAEAAAVVAVEEAVVVIKHHSMGLSMRDTSLFFNWIIK